MIVIARLHVLGIVLMSESIHRVQKKIKLVSGKNSPIKKHASQFKGLKASQTMHLYRNKVDKDF